ncbi:MAG: glucose-6-phosphate 1-dehydrogenase, partial [Mycobacterium sp.]|nr:glucose-6-phosphate 1-dehydrogenase [Mycobacterium sp.]
MNSSPLPPSVKNGRPACDFAAATYPVALRGDCGGGSMPSVATSKPQTIAYPAPGSRPYGHDDFSVDPHVVVLFGATGDLARR